METRNKKMIGGKEFIQFKNTNYYGCKDGRVWNNRSKKICIDKDKFGYIRIGGKKCIGMNKMIRGHQIIMELFGPPRPSNKHEIDHINAIRDDNRIENLQWLTRKENINKGNIQTGQPKHRKLTSKQAEEIKEKYSKGNNQYEIAKAYKVTQRVIWKIINNKSYIADDRAVIKRMEKPKLKPVQLKLFG